MPSTFRWVNPASGDFGTASNWQDQAGNPGVPSTDDDALILNSAITVTSSTVNAVYNLTSTATLDITGGLLSVAHGNLIGPLDIAGGGFDVHGRVTVGTVVLSGGTLNAAGQVTVTSDMSWTGGTVDSAGGTVGAALNIAKGATLAISGAALKVLDDSTLTNAGTVTWAGSGGFEFRHYATVVNNGLFTDQADHTATFVGIGSEVATLRNAGTFQKEGGAGITDIGVVLDNTGTVRAKSGTLRFSADVTQVQSFELDGGTWYVGAGAKLDFSTDPFDAVATSVTLEGPGAIFTPLVGLNFNSGDFTLTNGATLTTTTSLFSPGKLTVGPASGLTLTSLDLSSSSRLTFEIAGRPASFQFGRIALTSSGFFDGALAVNVVPGADTLNADVYTLITGSSISGTFDSVSQSGAGTVAPFNVSVNATTLKATATTDLTDLAVTTVTAPLAAAAPGDPVAISWTVKNNATVATTATDWTDSVYVSTSPTFDATATLVSQVPHSGTLAAGASYIGNYLGPLPGVPVGDYYVFVRSDAGQTVADADRTNNLAASVLTFMVNPPTLLTLGVSTPSTVAADRDAWYRVDAPGGTGLVVTASFAVVGGGELYVGYSEFPQVDSAIGSATDASTATEQVVLPATQAGTYYLRVHGLAGGMFNIQADTVAFSITKLVNTSGGNTGSATLTVHGVGFTPNTTVTLTPTGGGTARAATKVLYVDSDTVYATFDLKGLATGGYDVTATDGTHSATSVGGYTVTNATAGKLSYQIIQPATVGQNRMTYAYVEFTNNGGTDIPAPLLVLESTGFSASLNLVGEPPSEESFSGDWIYFLPTSTDAPAGLIPPGYRGRIPVAISTTASAGSTIDLTLSEVNSGKPIPWSDFDYIVQIPDQGFHSPAERAIYANFVAGVGKTSDTYAAALRDAATYLAMAGTPIRDAGALIAYLLRQADTSFPTRTLDRVTDASFPAPGLGLSFTRDFVPSVQGRYRSGRLGNGWVDNWDISVKWDGFSTKARVYTAGIMKEYTSPIFNGTTYYSSDGEDVLTYDGTRFVLTAHDGSVTAFRADKQLDYLQAPDGTRVTAGYDVANHLASLTHSSGRALTFTANKAGLITSVTDPGGLLTTFKYSTTHLMSATGPDGTEKYTYKGGPAGAKNALTSITAPSGVKSVYVYDKQGRLTSRTIGKTQAVVYTYGPGGGVTATPAGGTSVTLVSDFEGRTASLRDNTGSDLRMSFDASGRVARTETAAGQIWTQVRNDDGHVTAITDPLGHTVQYSYQDNFLTGYTDARGFNTSYQIDATGNRIAIAHPGGGTEKFIYDPAGVLVESINRRGNAVQTITNADGQITRRIFADGSHTDYVLDPRGNVASVTDSVGGTTTMTYFANDLLQKVTYPNGKSLEFTYDKGGRRATMVESGGFTTAYVYDAADRLAGLRDGTGATIVNYTYDASGRPSRKDNANGTFTMYAYDPFGRIQSIVNHATDATAHSQFDYTYDAAGNVATMTTAGVTTTYGYDLTGQLTSVTMPGRTIIYAYDAAGNRTSVTDNGVPTNYTVNNENQVTVAGTTTFTYDADGNRQTMTDAGGMTTYTWDDLNRLTGVTSPTDTFAYTYDSFQNLLDETRNGQTTTNVTDPIGLGTVTAQYGPGGLLAHYVSGLGLEARVDGAGAKAFYDFDRIGSVVGMTDSTGAYVNRYAYLPFGETTTLAAALANPFTYVGRWGVSSDGNGLFNMRARSYDPTTGGFVSDDPLGIDAGDPNIRRYAGNNPGNLIDPTGLSCTDDEIAALEADIARSDAIKAKYDGEMKAYHTYEQYLLQNHGTVNLPGFGAATLNDVVKLKEQTQRQYNKYGYGDWKQEAKNQAARKKRLEDCKKEKEKKKHHPDLQEASPGRPPVPKTKKPPQTPPQHTVVEVPPLIVNPPAGPGGTIPKKKPLPYSVDVVNPSTDKAVHSLHVTQQLDSDLDFNTFEFGGMDLGAVIVDVPAGRSSYQTRVDAREFQGIYVDVKAGINRSTGVVTWDITAIDPVTLHVPQSGDFGLLSPDTFTKGSLFYTVGVLNSVANGASIDSSATITVDGGSPVVTPNVSSPVDASGPTTTVNPLPAKSPASFKVGWSATDTNGVAFYDVFVSVDGASFVLWLGSTTVTTATYKGKAHHTYGFAVVAHDNVGNETPFPGAQATTST
ncbi:MAG TPA: RHS repeat-associated core domain-containing protein [Gemmataceae bacterium]|nr:RHS repeat-associated core domain-containing protein [Gemmataceae bacterium]